MITATVLRLEQFGLMVQCHWKKINADGVANSEDPDQTAPSDLALHYLLRTVPIFRNFMQINAYLLWSSGTV